MKRPMSDWTGEQRAVCLLMLGAGAVLVTVAVLLPVLVTLAAPGGLLLGGGLLCFYAKALTRRIRR